MLTALCYAPSLRHGVVYEDANWLRTVDQWVWPTVPGRTLTYLSQHLTWRAVGVQPAVMHAINLCVHLLNGVLLWGILRRWAGACVALTALAVFLLHPLTSAAVLYLTGRADLLMTLGLLLALWCAAAETWTSVTVVWLVLALLAAMASKELGIVGPIVVGWTLLLQRRWPRVSRGGLWLGAVVGVAMLTLIVFRVPSWFEMPPSAGGSALPWGPFWIAQGSMTADLLLRTVWLGGYTIDHDALVVSPWTLAILPLLAVYGVVVRRPLVTWALGVIALATLPRWVFRTSEFVTEPQLYLSMVGVATLVGASVGRRQEAG